MLRGRVAEIVEEKGVGVHAREKFFCRHSSGGFWFVRFWGARTIGEVTKAKAVGSVWGGKSFGFHVSFRAKGDFTLITCFIVGARGELFDELVIFGRGDLMTLEKETRMVPNFGAEI